MSEDKGSEISLTSFTAAVCKKVSCLAFVAVITPVNPWVEVDMWQARDLSWIKLLWMLPYKQLALPIKWLKYIYGVGFKLHPYGLLQ